MTLQEQIDRVLELDVKRTQGEWRAEKGFCMVELGKDGAIYDEGGHTEDDAQFIASAPDMVEIIRKRSEALRVAKTLFQAITYTTDKASMIVIAKQALATIEQMEK